ncbi:MAG: hypothetical protein U0L88_08815 [Acutalibacteraceae bacterium]|nr:hypothetical protein [Acutalibacteraceae bacterium]
MFQNIKVDIIYYKTPTDFEMEFNLSGCCRMRLLTDKAPDRKVLVNQMVRAVSRSRIIIVSGTLFGEDSIIETCSKAIGKPLAEIDNKQFGIDSDENISVIKDSVPLVSKEGIFGGCIIEQGPQTLILLTENKSIRKGIMQNLIHPYIQEIVASELVEKEEPAKEPVEEITEESVEEIQEDITDTAEELPQESEEATEENEETEETAEETPEPVNQLILDDEDFQIAATSEEPQEDYEPDENSNDLYVETDKKGRGFKRADSYHIDYDSEGYIIEQYEEDLPKKSDKKLNISILVLSVVLLLVVAVLCYCIFAVPQSEGVSAGAYLKETFNTLFG